MNLIATVDRRYVPSHRASHRHVKVVIQAPEAELQGQRPPVNVAIVLDRSGSMGGGKFRLAQQAVQHAIARLDGRDRLALVVFDQEVELVHPSQPATANARARALAALANYGPRGTTNLGEGWLVGCGQVAESLSDEAVGRCMLLTDGLANVGIVDTPTLCHHATELRNRGVSISTFGVGADFDEELLGKMADSGGGAFQYIRQAEDIPRMMDQELGETLEVVARRVQLEVILPPGVTVSVIGPYEVEVGDGVARILLPDLVSGQLLDLPLKLGFPAAAEDTEVQVRFTMLDREGFLGGLAAQADFAYADRAANRAQARDVEVDRFVAERYAARAMQVAARLNRDGDFAAASKTLSRVARRISRYAGADDQLDQLSQQLEEESQAYQAPVSMAKRKADYFQGQTVSSARALSGKRKRWKA